MTPEQEQDAHALEQQILQHIASSLQDKQKALDKKTLSPEDKQAAWQELQAKHQPATWLDGMAQRARQVRLATHTVKPLHPDARGSSLRFDPKHHPAPAHLLGSHSLPALLSDVAGNSAALNVPKFLSLSYAGRSLLQRLQDADPAMWMAWLKLADGDEAAAQRWQADFLEIIAPEPHPSSHTLAKQVYFPLPDGGYHLLALLFPSSVVHAQYLALQEARFSDEAKAARIASSKKLPHPHGYRDFPQLLIQRIGGSNAQNAGQLSAERRGQNWLLAAVPPQWRTQPEAAPYGVTSVFDGVLGRRRPIRDAVQKLGKYLARLANTQHNNKAMRDGRQALLEDICLGVLDYAERLRKLAPGWSAQSNCQLPLCEALWLDPLRVHQDAEFYAERIKHDWPEQVSQHFALWLNHALRSHLDTLDDASHYEWRRALQCELNLFRDILHDNS